MKRWIVRNKEVFLTLESIAGNLEEIMNEVETI